MEHSTLSHAGSRHFQVKQVANGVFAAISAPGTGSLGNSAIIDLGDAALVVDTFLTVQAAEDLRTAAMELTGKPVSYVVNTHWHSDHISGNQVFAPGAQIIATTATRRIMATFGADRLARQQANPEAVYQEIRETDKQIAQEPNRKLKQEMQWENDSDREYANMLPDFIYTLPTVTFDKEIIIHGKDRTARIMTCGGGHTQSDAFVYLPEERIAVMGDLVLSKHHPFMGYADLKAWLQILEQVEELGVDAIIPGHGEICAMDAVHKMKCYINDITALTKEAAHNRTSLEDIAVPEAYSDWFFTPYFRGNLKKACE